jgi:hypothetical protein
VHLPGNAGQDDVERVTLPEVIHCSIVIFSHRLPSHRKSGPPATHVISKASAMATLASHGVDVDADEAV